MLCLLDLSKCFGVIDHELLMQKLMLHGIETWFATYLHGHTQSVLERWARTQNAVSASS